MIKYLFSLGLILLFESNMLSAQEIQTGAFQYEQYEALLSHKKVALLVNQTSTVGKEHLVDMLIKKGVQIVKIFAPEHGFRGQADAGEKVNNTRDAKTGIEITSMYGASKKPSKESMQGIDIVVFDIQDVGVRFYTYISSLQYMMEACAEADIPIIVLDRPNPNGFYVDGPVLDKKYKSFVGMQPIPVVHGMTVGEYAKMLLGEKWLNTQKNCTLHVVPCKNYTHSSVYELPIAPSPNLKNMNAIYLYPSLCFFEGTEVSVGRGTDHPFEIWGHPNYKKLTYQFTPQSTPGAKHPLLENKKCFGENLIRKASLTKTQLQGKLNLQYLIQAYNQSIDKKKFFNSFFEKLAGTERLRKQIESGLTETAIRTSWQADLATFKKIRKKYLLYKDFE
ncbi:MAG: DUF1343 domain-containing protein [Chitinophagaceae bacterium]